MIKTNKIISALFLCFSLNGMTQEDTSKVAQPAIIFVESSDLWEDEEPTDGIYDFPEVEAQFKGGKAKFQKYIGNNIVYPVEAIEKNITGTVYLAFVVGKDGSISDVRVERGVHELLDRAAKDVVRDMPKWKPAKVKGKKVATRMRLPIVFTLD